jgi:hypothetical protein
MGRVVFAGYRRHKKGDPPLTPNPKPGAPGSLEGGGNLVMVPMVTDYEAIEKILSSRYLTTSISSEPESVSCSICGFNFVEGRGPLGDTPCEHEKGGYYEAEEGFKKLCYYTMGPLHGVEISYVNAPSDTTSRNVDPDIGETGLRLLLGDKPVGKKEFHFHDAQTLELVAKFDLEEGAYAENFELIPSLAIMPQSTFIMPGGRKDAMKESVLDKETLAPAQEEQDERQADSVLAQEEETSEAIQEEKGTQVEAPEATQTETAEVNLTYGELFGLDKTDESFSLESSLSSAQRKKLPGSVFCGPNRSFPAHDREHILQGLRTVGRYKGPGSKEKIKQALLRKGKKYGIGAQEFEGKALFGVYPIQIETPEGIFQPFFVHDKASCEAMLEEVSAFVSSLDEATIQQIALLAKEEGALETAVSISLIDEEAKESFESEESEYSTRRIKSEEAWPLTYTLLEHYADRSYRAMEAAEEKLRGEARKKETLIQDALASISEALEGSNIRLVVTTQNEASSEQESRASEKFLALFARYKSALEKLLKPEQALSLEDLEERFETYISSESSEESAQTEDLDQEEKVVNEEIPPVDPASIERVESPLLSDEQANLSLAQEKEVDLSAFNAFDLFNLGPIKESF